ncbi:bifunctional phosphoribosyl-AMP cyclohydrolase/phosphoribosyl-ATP diphosphatase HisIE [Anoxynatronum sibiricum]|uniref:Histidine biosynthesis bifunctional protein HisIE n=1 Tax=Anoxynatronum sibiricum TaxID=210623 RepID=A0ABU9VX11_9CLOT
MNRTRGGSPVKKDLETLTYNDQGLIPAIVQEAGTGEVLMMAYMNRESLEKTLETGETWFYSRSRQQLWHKGETSGHVQQVKRVQVDCDEDTLLLTVVQTGAACHTGEKSCFYRSLEGAGLPAEDQEAAVSPEMAPIIRQIVTTLEERRRVPKEGSYTNYLFDKGIDKILKKVGEEAAEIIIAAKNPAKEELIYELSDLVYHVLVLMNERQVEVAEVLKELESRHKK